MALGGVLFVEAFILRNVLREFFGLPAREEQRRAARHDGEERHTRDQFPEPGATIEQQGDALTEAFDGPRGRLHEESRSDETTRRVEQGARDATPDTQRGAIGADPHQEAGVVA